MTKLTWQQARHVQKAPAARKPLKHFAHMLSEGDKALSALPTLPVRDTPMGRHYILPDGTEAISMTTLLGHELKDKNKALDKWKKRVGEAEAAKISVEATTKGKSFHSMAESYLKNEFDYTNLTEPEIHRFECALSSLNRIDNVRLIEQGMYSKFLKIAGTVDAIAEFDGVLSVIDHKTSRALKREDWVYSYFLQETGYALMYEEMTGVKIDQIVTIISVEEENFCQVFVKKTSDYEDKLMTLIAEYYREC
jgi:genome maintenance exonuclease 1